MSPSHAWFTHDRFGLFVHFGLYSIFARHEWVMSREKTPAEEYEPFADFFDPDLFDAKAIVAAAKDAGMRYVVLTAKHHEGFALFDSALTEYTSQRVCGRDLVREFTDACHEAGLKVGLYFSVIDWHHPDFTIDYEHPLRDHPEAREWNANRDMARYRAYLHGQVEEVLTGYGKIDYLFFDYTYDYERDGWEGKGPSDWAADELLALTRRLQPGIIVNDRLGIPADVITPEQYQPDAPVVRDGVPVTWEACQTLNGSWGYDRDNTDFKSTDLLARMLVDTVSKGGNMLLNIGPDGRGAITARDRATLADLGEWMRLHESAVIGAGPSEFTAPEGTVLTQRGDRLYVHVFAWPFAHIHLRELAEQVRYARFLHDGSQVLTSVIDPDQQAWNMTPGGQPPGTLTLHLPVGRPDVLVPVIELFLSGNGGDA